ncbi:hypothetical protein [Petroclostridium sp. X23]|uniref:FMN-binding protein n=1 Tax=Petroclostridium sp. X23 TaxID=3045146 RepID=UPI0024AE797C|nr:hypothetical protein [Petroclostridium sp. X23]WHH57632.1 hypothetical protein QKW49_17615 [Petroclostridium sp. X23]
MLKKKALAVGLSVVIAAGLFAGCAQKKEESKPVEEKPAQTENKTETKAPEAKAEAGNYKDGIYFAQEDKFDEKTGWKYVATLEVKDGKIVKADWNGAHVKGGDDKDTQSKDGRYGMKEKGKAQAEWHEQAEKAEAYLIETQDPAKIEYKDEEGHTDAISGASIHVKEFFDLAKAALDKGPVGKGAYKDGAYHAEQKDFDAKTGWKYTADLTVINGYIVAADWNGVHKDGGDDKDTQSKDGRYGMKEKGKAQAEWHEQAEKAEAYLLETQDPTKIEYKDEEGHTDAISGASIHVKEFFDLAQEALANAK